MNRNRRAYSQLGDRTFDNFDTSYQGSSYHQQAQPTNMARGPLPNMRLPKGSRKSGISVISSYVFDWITIIVILGVSLYMNNHTPNKRPFSLEDPNISFPYTENETVPTWLLITLCAGVPVVVIPIISLIFVPGHTVPRGTPKSLIWKRKLWELHVGWLGLALSIAAAWFITDGMKNLFGKPRPDLLARCNPDLENFAKYVVGGTNINGGDQRLVSADICQGVAGRDLDDGFRSYPSGHSSSSAAGLIYLSLFIASKFAITFPFLAPGSHSLSPSSFSAFPSRRAQGHLPLSQAGTETEQLHPSGARLYSAHNANVASARRQAAAPPVYLLILATAPFFTSVFVASSRWFDFRHHGFDILFGFLIGTVSAFFAFRWYHLPVSQGAGWAWGPRCADKAWWAGVGSFSYAMDWEADVADGDLQRDEAVTLEEGRAPHKAPLSMATTGSDGGLGDIELQDAQRRAT